MVIRRLIPSIIIVSLLAGIHNKEEAAAAPLYQRQTKVMGTTLSLTIYGKEEKKAAIAAEKVIREFQRIEKRMTSWRPTGDVWKINNNAGIKTVKVSTEVFFLITKAQEISRETHGAFDISVGAFRGLWKFGQDRDGSIPISKEIKKRLPLVNHRNIHLDSKKKTVYLSKKGMRITLGGIAKGYAVDQAVKILRKNGLTNFLIQAGGDLYLGGMRGDRKWRAAIRNPRGSASDIFALTSLQNQTFSTSGDYERYIIKRGKRFHHILNPKTGYPAQNTRSVTVQTQSALEADAWSTALFVLGPKKGVALVEKKKFLEAVFVGAKNRIHISTGLKSKLIIVKKPSNGI